MKLIKRVSNLKYRTDFYKIINHRDIKYALEIGVEFGYNARDILSNFSSIEKLYLVDPFNGSLNKKQFWKSGRIIAECKKNIGEFSSKVKYIKKKSWEASKDFDNNSLDFIHIDGAHHINGVITDLVEWWPKMKEGAIFSGHDYYSKSKKRNVLPAVNWLFKDRQIFCTNESRRELVNSPTWWVIKEGDLNFDINILNQKRIKIPNEFFLCDEEYVKINKF